MDLIGSQKAVWLDAKRRRHPGAIFRDVFGGIARADAAVEAGIEAAGRCV